MINLNNSSSLVSTKATGGLIVQPNDDREVMSSCFNPVIGPLARGFKLLADGI